MSKSSIVFFVCLLLIVGCKSSGLAPTNQVNTIQTSPSPTMQRQITEVPILRPTSLSVTTQSLSATVPVNTPTPFIVAVVPTESSIEIDINLREYITQKGIVLYTKLEQGKFPLLSWPELRPILNEPLFKTIYGEQIGYLYTSDFAPDSDATGQYLLVPGVISETSASPNNTTTWLIDLNTERIQSLEKILNPLSGRPTGKIWPISSMKHFTSNVWQRMEKQLRFFPRSG